MTDGLMLFFAGVQTAVIGASGIFAWISIRKFRDSRAVDFVINAENNFDPLYHTLIQASPDLIRNVYRTCEELVALPDNDVRAFPFMQSLYAQVARIHYMVADQEIDLGLRPSARNQLSEVWIRTLSSFAGHPAMQAMHASAVRVRDYNEAFLARAAEALTLTVDKEVDGPVTPDPGQRNELSQHDGSRREGSTCDPSTVG